MHRLVYLPLFTLVGVLLALWGALAVAASPAATNRHVAPTGVDSGACTNSAAPCATIQYALDQAGDGDVILIAAGVYTENLHIATSITLHGEDAATTIVDGSAQPKRVIAMNYSPPLVVTIRNLSIRNGKGGVIASSGSLWVESSRIYANDATGEFYDEGGGVFTFGSATISNTAVYSNVGQYGGGVYARADITITASAIYSNVAEYSGGGVDVSIGDGENRALLSNSTVSGNRAFSAAGVNVGSAGTQLTLRHMTIAYNQCAIGSNTPAGLSVALGVSTAIANTIIAVNSGSSQCNSGVNITSLGGNLSNDNSCGLTNAADQLITDPLLNSLQGNGGPTWTHALAANSSALDAGVADHCLLTDQRGHSRPSGAACDSGAYEADGAEPPANSAGLYLPLVLR
ncbi:MAG TPA: hypothetical protein GYA08_04180 [Chloroflexi bacterium]|nr:hypothetical protein [Chloroflexota bacterium]